MFAVPAFVVAGLAKTSKYGMPFMEGEFSSDPKLDNSTDPIGNKACVNAMCQTFGVDATLHPEQRGFTLLECAVFATVVRAFVPCSPHPRAQVQ